MSRLYIIPTPIGNLEDITLRAIRLLKEVDLILAEDTRTTAKLLQHFSIETRMQSHHQHNEHRSLTPIIEQLKNGTQMALVSDAGTPGISDPGFLLCRACLENDIEVECLPGATALIPALVNSGFPCDRFFFEGFLPQKKGKQTRLKYLAESPYTVVLYESPFRLVKTLTQLIEHVGVERRVSVSRELSKKFEENVRGTLQEVVTYFQQKKVKGEIVIVLEGKGKA